MAFAAPHPGKLKQIDLAGGASWLCQRDSFLCATDGIEIGIAFTKRFGRRALRRRGLHPAAPRPATAPCSSTAAATSSSSTWWPGQTLRVDTGCIVAFEENVQYDIQFVGGFKNALFGGEGLFLATLTGPGKCVLQTLPFSRLAGRIMGLTREGTGGVAGVGGTLRDIGNIFGGDE